MRRIIWTVFFALLATVALTGCEARTNVTIEVAPNGGGHVDVTVILDKEAAASVTDLNKQLRKDDLEKAGWRFDGPKVKDDRSVITTATHDFSNAEQANQLFSQLGGPFRNFRLTEKRTFTSIDVAFDGVLDMTKGIESFDTSAFDPTEIQKAFGVDYEKSFPVSVTVKLPGNPTYSANTSDGTWNAKYGSFVNMHAQSAASHRAPLILLIMAGVLLLATLIVAVVWKSGKYRGRHRKKLGRGGVRAKDLLAQLEENKKSKSR